MKKTLTPALVAICLLIFALGSRAFGQAPALLWTTNIGATLFAVDVNTNGYANSGGTVIKLNGDGVTLETKAICPIPGIAQRDANGNFYFAGIFDGTQDFGGITLVGGWTNFPITGKWIPGYPTYYVAKYASNGSLQWVTSFGQQGVQGLYLTDLLVDSGEGIFVGHVGGGFSGLVTRLDNTGHLEWTVPVNAGPDGPGGTVKLGGLTSSNICYFRYGGGPQLAAGRRDYAGNNFGESTYTALPLLYASVEMTHGTPVLDNLARVFLAGRMSNGQSVLCKFALDGSLVWALNTESNEQWPLARDLAGNVYFGAINGVLIKYDTDGTQIWSTNHQKEAIKMQVDPSGNRFVGFADGSVARIAVEPAPVAPGILSGPQGQTVFSGTNVTLSVSASGTQPLRYFWRRDGISLPGGTNSTLNLVNPISSQSGNYSVIVTNAGGAITSTPPALVRIKAVQFFLGNQMLTNGTYSFQTSPTLSVLSAFTNGSSFYTLDGSAPTFASPSYTGPFAVPSNSTVRALGYSANFSQSEEADPVNIVLPPQNTLTTSTVGPGSVSLNPPGGLYPNASVVTATATPSAGWIFLYWKGDVLGTGASTSVTMDKDKSIQAVFGSTLAATVSGSGQVQMSPPGGVYPYGSVIRLTGIPQPGNYFGVWGNAASGNANPLYFTLTNSNPTVSSLFAPLSANQAALTVLINGPGTIQVNPAGNVFTTNQSVNITATPLAGQGFINWSGDATGTANPVSVAMTQSRVVTANFTNWPVLVANHQSVTPQGFRLTIQSGPGLVYQIQASANLGTWTNLGVVTNTSGESFFTDPAGTNLPSRFYRGTSWP